MFKGFCIRAHVIATVHDNGELKSFLENAKKCKPNLAAIADSGMPSGTGCKGGKAKCKRNRKITPIETRSVRPCLDQNFASAMLSGSNITQKHHRLLKLHCPRIHQVPVPVHC